MIRDAADLALRFDRARRMMPASVALATAEAAKVVEGSVKLASGPYSASRLTAMRTTLRRSPPSALVAMTSPKAHLLDHDTKAHDIVAKRADALATPYGARSSVHHPGTIGKHMWETGVAAAAPAVTEVIRRAVRSTARKAFA